MGRDRRIRRERHEAGVLAAIDAGRPPVAGRRFDTARALLCRGLLSVEVQTGHPLLVRQTGKNALQTRFLGPQLTDRGRDVLAGRQKIRQWLPTFYHAGAWAWPGRAFRQPRKDRNERPRMADRFTAALGAVLAKVRRPQGRQKAA